MKGKRYHQPIWTLLTEGLEFTEAENRTLLINSQKRNRDGVQVQVDNSKIAKITYMFCLEFSENFRKGNTSGHLLAAVSVQITCKSTNICKIHLEHKNSVASLTWICSSFHQYKGESFTTATAGKNDLKFVSSFPNNSWISQKWFLGFWMPLMANWKYLKRNPWWITVKIIWL